MFRYIDYCGDMREHHHHHYGRGPGPGFALGEEFGEHMRRMGRRFKRGMLKFVILKRLADDPGHGYDLIREFRRKGWGGGGGSIYPILSALEEEKLIAGRDEGDRRIYEITEEGRKHLSEQGPFRHGFFEDADEDAPEEGDGNDLRSSAGRLMQAVMQIGRESKPETVQQVRELLDRARKEVYTLLAQE
jgi:DNA-binding PadR family transcriptional regulator